MKIKTALCGMVSDEQLWQQSRTGDREAFGSIVERYQSLVCSLAYTRCGSLSRSEDLAQETFLIAWQQLGELREPSKLRAWLCGIVRHLAAKAMQREQRRGGPSESLEVIDEPASNEADPAAQVVTKEEETLLWRSLSGLPDTYREPMVLFYRQGQSVAEVALALDASEDAIKQRLSRGRAMLRDELATVVESTLARSAPTGAFTVAVLAALPIVGPTGAEAAVVAGAVSSKGAAAGKAILATLSKWLLLGPAIGLIIGVLSTRAVTSIGRSPEERACLRRHALRMVIFSWLMSIGLALVLLQAGKLYTPSPLWIILGVFVWVGVLVGTILWASSRNDREVMRLRIATGTDDTKVHDVQSAEVRRSGACWPKLPYESKLRFLGLPLIAISELGDASPDRKRKAVGWIAIGDFAISPFFALGGVAISPLAMGGITIGLVSFSWWGIAIGALAFGSIALGWWSFGLGAIGWKAAAGGAVVARDYALGALASAREVNTPAVKEWFLSQWFTVVAQAFLYSAHWLILLLIVVALGRAFYKARQWRRAAR